MTGGDDSRGQGFDVIAWLDDDYSIVYGSPEVNRDPQIIKSSSNVFVSLLKLCTRMAHTLKLSLFLNTS